jgi:hypothetical protein
MHRVYTNVYSYMNLTLFSNIDACHHLVILLLLIVPVFGVCVGGSSLLTLPNRLNGHNIYDTLPSISAIGTYKQSD